MNKQELITAISNKAGTTKKDAEVFVDAFVEAVTEALADGEKVQLVGFGTFLTRDRAAREGRDPQTGERIQIAATTVPAFKAGARLKDAVKG